MIKNIVLRVSRISHETFTKSLEIEILKRNISVNSVNISRQDQYLSITFDFENSFEDKVNDILEILRDLEAKIPPLIDVVKDEKEKINNRDFIRSNAFK